MPLSWIVNLPEPGVFCESHTAHLLPVQMPKFALTKRERLCTIAMKQV